MSELAACRMCLAVDARMYAIADTPLQDVYERITDIPLQNGDKRPKKVCYLCHHLLRKHEAFMKKSVKADELLRLVLDKGIELTEAYVRLMDTSDVCSSLCISREVLEDFAPQKQSKDVEPQRDESTEIRVKVEPPDVKEEMEVEIEGLYGTSEYPDTMEKGSTTPKQWTQTSTLHETNQSSLFEIHVKQERVCSPDMENEDEKRKTSPENPSSSLMCEHCRIVLDNKQSLILHMRTHKADDMLQRNSETSIGEDFNEQSSKEHSAENILIKHLLINKEERPHRCRYCNKAFSDKSNLNQHMLIHTSEKPYECNYCNKLFPTNSHFKQHMLTHTGEKPHQCSYCDKAFASKNTLNRHVLIHTGEKPHRCTHCDRQFSQKSSLNHHILMHTGEKPHQCTVCERAFTNKRTLTRHMLIHTGEKPYRCNHCNRDFRQKDYLNQHMLIHIRETNLMLAEFDDSSSSSSATHTRPLLDIGLP